MIFGFSLYAVILPATLVAYSRSRLEKLSRLKPSKSSKMCYH